MLSEYNIATRLMRMAEEKPYKIAIYAPSKKEMNGQYNYLHYTYKKLNDESNLIAKGLKKQGITKGTKTVLMVTPSLDFFALAFALFKVGAIPILIDPGMGLKNLKQCLKEAAPDVFIGSLKAHVARVVFGWERGKFKNLITVGGKSCFCRTTLNEIRSSGVRSDKNGFPELLPSDTATIIFTSGSTGSPKGVVYTHQNFSALVDALKNTYGLGKDEIDLCTFPLFGLIAPALDMVLVIPVMDFTRPSRVDPKHIFTLIENFGVTNLFGSPAFIRRIAKVGLREKTKLIPLRRVISAGAPVPIKTLQEFSNLLNDDTQIFTPYGATEALPVTSIGSHEILRETQKSTHEGKGVCIGYPVDGVELFIIKITDDPIELWCNDLLMKDGEIGEITVSGAQVTERYINREDADRLNKIKNLKTNQIYHRMGDLGYRDKKGRIWFCGRKSHRIKTLTGTLFTIPIEAIFNRHKAVFRTALVGIPFKNAKKPVLVIEPERKLKKQQQEKLKNELLDLASQYKLTREIDTFLFYKNFPVDIRHNAKIDREKLGKWSEKKIV